MITCKLCGTELSTRKVRKDGSILCPECGQIYWKAAVDAALSSKIHYHSAEERKEEYIRQSMRSVERIRRALVA